MFMLPRGGQGAAARETTTAGPGLSVTGLPASIRASGVKVVLGPDGSCRVIT
jgi:hypothetical protein